MTEVYDNRPRRVEAPSDEYSLAPIIITGSLLLSMVLFCLLGMLALNWMG